MPRSKKRTPSQEGQGLQKIDGAYTSHLAETGLKTSPRTINGALKDLTAAEDEVDNSTDQFAERTDITMRSTNSIHARKVYLTFALLFTVAGMCRAQQRRTMRTATEPTPAHLNRILSASNAGGPLAGTHTIAAADQLLLFWSEPPQGTNGSYAAYHYQLMNYLNNSSLPVSNRLYSDGTLSGDTVVNAANNAEYPAISGNENPVVLAGDMSGDGYADVVSVWETSNNAVFASAQQVDASNLTFQNGPVTGVLVGYVPSASSAYDGKICARLGDLQGNGQKELVVAWHDTTDNKIHIAIYGWSASASSHLALLGSISDMPVSTSPAYMSMIALGTGDFAGNGRDEIALSGFKPPASASDTTTMYAKFYDVDSSYTITPKGVADFQYYSNVYSGTYIPPAQLVMATGNLTGNGRDEAVIALGNGGSGPFTNYYFADVYIVTTDSSLNNIYMPTYQSLPSFNTNYPDNIGVQRSPQLSLACGDLHGTGTDQIILGEWNNLAIFTTSASGQALVPVLQYNTIWSTTPVLGGNDLDTADFKYSNTFLKVADLDQSRKDEIVVMRDVYSAGFTATQSLDVTVLAATDSSSFALSQEATATGLMSETTSSNPGFRRHYSLALGDFDGSDLTLGTPTYFHVDSVVQPLVILNAPPVHFDIFNDTSYDICDVFNNGSNSGNFVATYNHSTTTTNDMQTTLNSSWGVDASLSGDFSYEAVKVSASLDSQYGRDFSKVQNSSYQTSVTINVNAEEDDKIYALVSGYDIWEYPVLDSGQVKGHVLVTVPDPPLGEWFDTDSWTAYSFVPDHVVGNILSYRTYSDSLQNNPYLLQLVKGSLSTGFQLGTGGYTWSLSTQDFTSNEVDTTKTFGLNVAASLEVGGEFGGFGASVKASVSGNYSNSQLVSHTSTVTDALNLTVNFGSLNTAIGEDEYTVIPYAYWAKNGALVVDYAVEPQESSPGGTPTWWQEFYGKAPDPAFALPYLYWPEEGFTVESPEKIYQTKEIYCSPENPAPGDTVTTTVRIHNYSLMPTDTSVEASFYVGNPDNGGTIIRSVDGDTVFSTPGIIPARGWQILSFKWIAPSKVNSRFIYASNYVHVWGVLNPLGTMAEIHKENDMGWTILDVPGVVTGIRGNESRRPVSFGLSQNFPNPFNPTTVITYNIPRPSHVRLVIYDILGREVETLVNGDKSTGRYQVTFDGSRLPSGVYFYRIQAGSHTATKKLMLIK